MRNKTIECISAVACCLTLGASAATYYVDNKLDDYTGHNGSSWALAYHRIQDAVARAASGDTVIVAPGTYGDDQGTVVDAGDTTGQNANYSYQKNRIWINNKHITLKSSEGAAVTHIVGKFADTETGIGSNAVRCIALAGNNGLPGTRIEGFTFREGATLAYNTGKTFDSSGAEVLSCPAAHRGGALLFNYTPTTTHRQVHVVDCVISNCVAAEGAAAYGVALVRCRVTRNNTYRDNGGTTVQCNAANCIFDFNGTANYEAVCRPCENNYPVTVVNCTFFGNKGITRSSSKGKEVLTVYNSLIQRNWNTTSSSMLTSWEGGTFTNCVSDCDVTTYGGNCVFMADRGNNSQLVAPLFGDYRPVAHPYIPHLFGNGDKAFCSPDWLAEADRNKDFFGNARWDANDSVTAGAIQDGVEVAGGCITVTCDRYSINGRVFDGPNNGYFYSTISPAQHRIKPLSTDGKELYSAWLGGYYSLNRIPDKNGEFIVTAPPASHDNMTCLQMTWAKGIVWADPSYVGGDSDGSEAKPYTTLQAAVDACGAYYIVKAKAGRYDAGGGYFWGNCRVRISSDICLRAVEGPENTFIVGANGDPANADGCGTNAYRCVGITASTCAGVVGFTLTDGRTCSNGEACHNNLRQGGGLFSDKTYQVQFLDCVITNCIAVRGSATYKGWLQNCRVVGNRQAVNPATLALSPQDRRGVVYYSYLSGCVVGPNSYTTVGIDQFCYLYNCTVNETSTTLHLSADSYYYNVLDLNGPTYQSNIKVLTPGLCIETTSNLALTNDYLKVSDAKLAARTAGDFRPLADSPILAAGTTNNVPNISLYTIGGFHKETFPAGQFPIGASSDVAVPVTVTNMRGIALSGGLGTPFVSAMYPLTLTATDTRRNFCGFYVNGALATKERTLTLEMLDGVASYSVEPIYASGTMMIIR